MLFKKNFKKIAFLPIALFLLSSTNYDDDIDRRFSLWPDEIKVTSANGDSITLGVNKQEIVNVKNEYELVESFMNDYPSLKMIGPPTSRYNCHSYSFICRGSFNVFVFEEPNICYSKEAYVLSDGSPGDIVVYMTKDSKPIHSGIVKERIDKTVKTSKDDLANIIVVSKRGTSALFEHKGNEFNLMDNVYSIRYYRLSSSHKHKYNSFFIPIDDNYHANVCSCGDYIQEGHMLSAGSLEGVDYAPCIYCNGYVSGGIYVR